MLKDSTEEVRWPGTRSSNTSGYDQGLMKPELLCFMCMYKGDPGGKVDDRGSRYIEQRPMSAWGPGQVPIWTRDLAPS